MPGIYTPPSPQDQFLPVYLQFPIDGEPIRVSGYNYNLVIANRRDNTIRWIFVSRGTLNPLSDAYVKPVTYRIAYPDGRVVTDFSGFRSINEGSAHTILADPNIKLDRATKLAMWMESMLRPSIRSLTKGNPRVEQDAESTIFIDEFGIPYLKISQGQLITYFTTWDGDIVRGEHEAWRYSKEYFTAKWFSDDDIRRMSIIQIIELYYSLLNYTMGHNNCPEWVPSPVVTPGFRSSHPDQIYLQFEEEKLKQRIYDLRTDMHRIIDPRTGQEVVGLIAPDQFPYEGGYKCKPDQLKALAESAAKIVVGLIPGVGIALTIADIVKGALDAAKAKEYAQQIGQIYATAQTGAEALAISSSIYSSGQPLSSMGSAKEDSLLPLVLLGLGIITLT